jgi:hypothetical protein
MSDSNEERQPIVVHIKLPGTYEPPQVDSATERMMMKKCSCAGTIGGGSGGECACGSQAGAGQ